MQSLHKLFAESYFDFIKDYPLFKGSIPRFIHEFLIDPNFSIKLDSYKTIVDIISNFFYDQTLDEIPLSVVAEYNFLFIYKLSKFFYYGIIQFNPPKLSFDFCPNVILENIVRKSFFLFRKICSSIEIDNDLPVIISKKMNESLEFSLYHRNFLNSLDKSLFLLKDYSDNIQMELFEDHSIRKQSFCFFRCISDISLHIDLSNPLPYDFLVNWLPYHLSRSKPILLFLVADFFGHNILKIEDPKIDFGIDRAIIDKKYKINFFDKKGVHLGFKVLFNNQGETSIFYVKRFHLTIDYQRLSDSFSYGSNYSSNIRKKLLIFNRLNPLKLPLLDVKEPFIYKMLEFFGIGPEVQFLLNPFIKYGFFILTKSLKQENLDYVDFSEYIPLKSDNYKFSGLEVSYLIIQHISFLFLLGDLKYDNFGVQTINDVSIIKIIDFLSPPHILYSDKIPSLYYLGLPTVFSSSQSYGIKNLEPIYFENYINDTIMSFNWILLKFVSKEDFFNLPYDQIVKKAKNNFQQILLEISSSTLSTIHKIPHYYLDWLPTSCRIEDYLILHGYYNTSDNPNHHLLLDALNDFDLFRDSVLIRFDELSNRIIVLAENLTPIEKKKLPNWA